MSRPCRSLPVGVVPVTDSFEEVEGLSETSFGAVESSCFRDGECPFLEGLDFLQSASPDEWPEFFLRQS